MKRYLICGVACFAALVMVARVRAGDNDGQADLDKATEKKLSAESLEDLSSVLDLCEKAMKAGLNPNNSKFANDLYTSTLLQRATIYFQNIFGDGKTRAGNSEWQPLRDLAMADLDKIVARDPKQGTAQLMIAKLQTLPGGDKLKALKAADAAVEQLKGDDEKEAAALMLRGAVETNPEKQLADLTASLKLAPKDPEALRARAIYYFKQKKYKEAVADLDANLVEEPKNAAVYELRGEALFMLKQNAEAMHSFEKAIELQPRSPLPYMDRARVRAETNDTNGALEDLQTALSMQPDNPMVLLARARIYQKMGENAKAKDDVDRAMKQDNEAFFLQELVMKRGLQALIGSDARDYSDVISDLEELTKVAPKNAHLLFQLGEFYSVSKKSEKAIEKFTASLAVDDSDEQVLRARGDAYLNIGKHGEAVKDYEKALKLKPDDSGLLNNFAWVLSTSPDDKVRDGKRAIELGKKSCEVTDYKAAHILSTLAAAYAEAGDFDNARKWSEKAVELGDDEVKEELKKELDSYKQNKPFRELLIEGERADSKSAAKPEEKK
jgi:tetratricopeptide (TPR) repeat protein